MSHTGHGALRLPGGYRFELGTSSANHHRFIECNYGGPESPLDAAINAWHDGAEEGNRPRLPVDGGCQRRSELAEPALLGVEQTSSTRENLHMAPRPCTAPHSPGAQADLHSPDGGRVSPSRATSGTPRRTRSALSEPVGGARRARRRPVDHSGRRRHRPPARLAPWRPWRAGDASRSDPNPRTARITIADGIVRLGALTTHNDVAGHPSFRWLRSRSPRPAWRSGRHSSATGPRSPATSPPQARPTTRFRRCSRSARWSSSRATAPNVRCVSTTSSPASVRPSCNRRAHHGDRVPDTR